MKAIFISFNQAFYDEIVDAFDRLGVRGYTAWDPVMGRGSRDGEPHLGSHTWPTLNSALLVIVGEPIASRLLDKLTTLDAASPQQGLRAFWWEIGGSI
ncbi:MAG: hypothetical protein LUC96_12625 [Alistipes sp.]|uniref:PG0541 family transporter-associated protein n=1 Tax=Alistipes sp. TaxID=1872444 RepID=UPI0025BC624D|nr:PG0541 family transporter-associated protein [Alistipes sp.]MCD8275799.1 hypothetical protein [Alistipes sp.]